MDPAGLVDQSELAAAEAHEVSATPCSMIPTASRASASPMKMSSPSCPVEERIALMRAFESGAFSVVELCRRYGISRDTFHVWKWRRDSGGERWFEDLSRAPGRCPHALPPETITAVLAMRARFPRFGPKKIKARFIPTRDQPHATSPLMRCADRSAQARIRPSPAPLHAVVPAAMNDI